MGAGKSVEGRMVVKPRVVGGDGRRILAGKQTEKIERRE